MYLGILQIQNFLTPLILFSILPTLNSDCLVPKFHRSQQMQQLATRHWLVWHWLIQKNGMSRNVCSKPRCFIETDNYYQNYRLLWTVFFTLLRKFQLFLPQWYQRCPPPKSMMHIVYSTPISIKFRNSPYFLNIYKFSPLFSFNWRFSLNLRFFPPHIMHHASHVLDARECHFFHSFPFKFTINWLYAVQGHLHSLHTNIFGGTFLHVFHWLYVLY